MNNSLTILTFPVNALTVSVRASDAYVVLDPLRNRSRGPQDSAADSDSVVYSGRSVPCLDLGRCLDEGTIVGGDRTLSLILEHGGEFACVRVPSVSVAWTHPSSKPSQLGPEFRGLARLLLVEQIHALQGDSYLLDVAMAVRLAHQPEQQLGDLDALTL